MEDEVRVAVIVGPTATGKSKVAVEVASRLGGEIISADSMQVYRGMDIGTAKLRPEDMYGSNGRYVPHHLIDIRNPDETFSVYEFKRLAEQAIAEITERGNLPLVVGGTGLYIKALLYGYELPENLGWTELREKFRAWPERELFERLKEVDPEAAGRIHPHDKKRLIRALEVYYRTGERMKREARKPPYRVAQAGLIMPRETLYARIEARIEDMVARGLVQEVKELLDAGYSPDLPSMQGLGYRQVAAYLRGQITWEEAVRLIKRDTRRYAKRQITWFKQDKSIKWFLVERELEIVDKITDYIGRTLGIIVE